MLMVLMRQVTQIVEIRLLRIFPHASLLENAAIFGFEVKTQLGDTRLLLGRTQSIAEPARREPH